MMKRALSKKFVVLLVLPVLAAALLVGCSKSEEKPAFNARSNNYTLANLSTGAAVDAGKFTITELADGNAKLSVQLNDGYKVAGVKFRTIITAPQPTGTDLLFADLGEMDGGTGTLNINPVVSGATNVPVKYTELIQSGYIIKVMNGNNLQAIGTIK